MLIHLKNKDTLLIDDFELKCCIGKNGVTKKKKEGDKCTPFGTYKLGKLYYRSDRVNKPKTKLQTKEIKKNMGWCNNPKSEFYNKEILIDDNNGYESLYRKDNKYNYIIIINYNRKKIIPYKGSAIFLHLTNNYKATAGCIAVKKSDFEIIIKLINKKTRIKIN